MFRGFRNSRRLRGRWWLALILATAVAAAPPCLIEAQTYSEDEVKAAYLYKFAKFVQWPEKAFENQEAPVVIGVLDGEDFARLLRKLVEGETVEGRPYVVRSNPKPEELRTAHILFVRRGSEYDLKELLAGLEQAPVLTVSDVRGFAQSGGMVNLVSRDKRITFEINLKAASEAGLHLSSRLLKLARIVETWEGM